VDTHQVLAFGGRLSLFVFATSCRPLSRKQYPGARRSATYFEAAVVIIALVFVGQGGWNCARVKRQQETRIPRASRSRAQDRAANLAGWELKYDAPLKNIMEGDKLRVRPRDAVPVGRGQ